MDDLIRRSYAYRVVYDYCGDYEPKLLENIEDIPAVDAVKVVRCRECRYCDIGENDAEAWCECEIFGAGVSEDGYCWIGQRREDGDASSEEET